MKTFKDHTSSFMKTCRNYIKLNRQGLISITLNRDKRLQALAANVVILKLTLRRQHTALIFYLEDINSAKFKKEQAEFEPAIEYLIILC